MRKLLVLDDDPSLLRAMQWISSEQLCDVVYAQTAQEAVTAMLSHKFDVVLADFHMPSLNGVEFLHLVRSLRPAASRVIITSHGSTNALTRAVNDGLVSKVLAKPLSREDILDVIAGRGEA